MVSSSPRASSDQRLRGLITFCFRDVPSMGSPSVLDSPISDSVLCVRHLWLLVELLVVCCIGVVLGAGGG